MQPALRSGNQTEAGLSATLPRPAMEYRGVHMQRKGQYAISLSSSLTMWRKKGQVKPFIKNKRRWQKMTPHFLYPLPGAPNEAKFLYANFMFIFLWMKKGQFCIPYRVHTVRSLCILSSIVVSETIWHIHTLPRWGRPRLMVSYPVPRCKGLQREPTPDTWAHFFQCRVPSKACPPFFIIIPFVPVMKKRLKNKDISSTVRAHEREHSRVASSWPTITTSISLQ